jgi:peptidoglycan L-alanyl-D-glutamate endopeptidase CwlK
MNSLNKRSRDNLATVKPALRQLFEAAIVDSPYNFIVISGKRTLAEQKVLLATGKTTTLNSRHLTGDAADIAVEVNGDITWNGAYYKTVAAHIKKVAKKLGIAIEWGGDWKSFIDSGHFQLAR